MQISDAECKSFVLRESMQILARAILLSILISVFASSMAISPASGQTVGNGTYFAPAAGAKENYGVNAASQNGVVSYPSLHTRGGSGSGIGSSFVDTTSSTAESSPAVSRPAFVADTVQQFHLPKLDSAFTESLGSPALLMFNPTVPKAPRSSALVDPLTGPFAKPNTFQPIEDLPSFNKKRSVTDWMQF
ncbi:MAG: hypothetical protein JST89_02215 [Cyanobacteria bacterium SZAS-4]|nr:hypothetical protein [Cyanobacteria bacterium SZAS-4]